MIETADVLQLMIAFGTLTVTIIAVTQQKKK